VNAGMRAFLSVTESALASTEVRAIVCTLLT